MKSDAVLTVDGAVERPLTLSVADLAAFSAAFQVHDGSRFHFQGKGDGVELEAILAAVGPLPEANYLTLHADRDDFHVSIPLHAVRALGILVYHRGGAPLAVEHGGPVRFLIPDPAACHSAELDDCANVKYLSRIELSVGRGRDTRPQTDEEHQRLHRETSSEPQRAD